MRYAPLFIYIGGLKMDQFLANFFLATIIGVVFIIIFFYILFGY